jgi:H/ACA ribonucleoprotein complex non-core subunit NAF1
VPMQLSPTIEMEAGYEGFKVPSTIPQDLLLIQDLVSPIIASTKPVTPPATDDDSVDSSGESTDSADEAEAILLSTGENAGGFASYLNNAFL